MYKIVLVDDEPWAMIYLRKIFAREDLGFEVVAEECSSAAALRTIERLNPNVVITDVRIPDMTGLELLQHLREAGMECEMVIVSAFAEFTYAQTALRYGAFDYCVKPVSAGDAGRLLQKLSLRLEEKAGKIPTLGNIQEDEDSDSDYIFQKVLTYINIHYGDKLMLKELAADFGFSPNYCSSLFVKKTGMTFSQYLTRLRMEQAVNLMRNPKLSIRKIALAVGYEDEIYFYKVFKKHYEITPAQWREKNAGSR